MKGFNDPGGDTVTSEKPNVAVLIAPCFEPLKDNWFYYVLENKYKAELLSPTQNISKSKVQFLCLMGTKDEYNALSTATEFDRLMKEKKNLCRLIIQDGYHHNGFMNQRWNEFIMDFINNCFK